MIINALLLGAHKRDGSGTENDSESSTDGSSQVSEGMFSHGGFFLIWTKIYLRCKALTWDRVHDPE